MAKELLQCERSFLRSEVEQSRLSIWELMELYENSARKDILSECLKGKYSTPEEIYYEWSRRKVNFHQFVLRAWCFAREKK